MTVLRDRASDPGGPQDQRDVAGRQLCAPTAESAEEPPSGRIQAVVCNGNGVVGGSCGSLSREEISKFPHCFRSVLQECAWVGKMQCCEWDFASFSPLSLCRRWALGVS